MLVARYYTRFHLRNSSQLNFRFLRHRTFDGDVDTIDDLLSDPERAPCSFPLVTSWFSNKLHSSGLSKDAADDNKKGRRGQRLRIAFCHTILVATQTKIKKWSFCDMRDFDCSNSEARNWKQVFRWIVSIVFYIFVYYFLYSIPSIPLFFSFVNFELSRATLEYRINHANKFLLENSYFQMFQI